MKKFYTIAMALAVSLAGASSGLACDNSSFTLNSHTDLGGGLHQYTVTFCAGSGSGGAVGQTGLWAVMLGGGATFSSFPATLTSPNTQAVYGADNSSYGPEYLVYDAISWPSNSPYMFPNAWTCLQGNCGPAGATCITFTYVTVGAPTSMTLMGAEAAGVGVPPYGCNGQPEMVISLDGPVVEAGNTVMFCLGGCTTLNATVSGGTAPYTYSWAAQYNAGVISTNPSVAVCPTANELYLLTVTDANGSSSSDYVSVVVYQPPVASAGPDQLKYRGYGPTSVTLVAYANNSMGPYTYAWSNGATTKNIVVSPNVTTNYTLTVTDARGCTKSDVATVTVRDVRCGAQNNKVSMCKNNQTSCVNASQVPTKLNQGFVIGACGSFKLDGSEEEFIAEESADLTTGIFPNPATDMVNIRFGFDADATVSIQVYDMSGRVVQTVMNGAEVLEGQLNNINFSVSDFHAGLYFITITTANGEREMHKLMVTH